MISKISAIVAAAVVLASASVASAQTVYAPSFHNSYHNQDTSNLRHGHANDPQFDIAGRCLKALRRTKFCASCSDVQDQGWQRVAAILSSNRSVAPGEGLSGA